MNKLNNRFLFLGLFGLLGLVGCAGQPDGPAPETLWPSAKSTTAGPQPTTQQAPTSPAVRSLLADADASMRQRDWQAVISIAEQGLHIDRREPRWYLLLAESYLALTQPDQSKLFAGQGLRYCRDEQMCQRLHQLAGSR